MNEVDKLKVECFELVQEIEKSKIYQQNCLNAYNEKIKQIDGLIKAQTLKEE